MTGRPREHVAHGIRAKKTLDLCARKKPLDFLVCSQRGGCVVVAMVSRAPDSIFEDDVVETDRHTRED
jgi:hypothetical protein